MDPVAKGQGILLDQNGGILNAQKGGRFCANVEIHESYLRPRLEIRIDMPHSNVVEDESAKLKIGHSLQQNDKTRLQKSINITLTIGASLQHVMPTESTALTTTDATAKKWIQDLPMQTKEQITAMRQPLAIRSSSSQFGVLSSDLAMNSPAWADKIREAVLDKGGIMLLIDTSDNFLKKYKDLEAKVRREPLTAFYQKERKSLHSLNTDHFNAEPKLPQPLNYQASASFRSLSEYVTIFNAAGILDRSGEAWRRKRYESSRKTLILVQTAQPRSHKFPRFYHALITKPEDGECTLHAGDTLEVQFDLQEDQMSTKWQATVSEGRGIQRDGYVSLHMTRGRYENKARYDQHTPSSVIYAHGLNKSQIMQCVQDCAGEEVKVKVKSSGKMEATIRQAYQTLNILEFTNLPAELAAPTYRQRIGPLLLGQRPDKLLPKDLYERVHRGLRGKNPLDFMQGLNPCQIDVVSASRHLPGGLQIIQGPPGTGKTFLAHQMCAPFFASSEESLLLVGAPTNHGADDLSAGLGKVCALQESQHDHLVCRRRYVVRYHSKKTELDIVQTQGTLIEDEAATNARASATIHDNPCTAKETPPIPVADPPSNPGTQNIPDHSTDPPRNAEDNLMLDDVFGELAAGAASKYEGVSDARLQHLEFSVGQMMLMVAGAYPGNDYAHHDQKRFAEFRRLHQKQLRDLPLSMPEQSFWESECEELFKMTIRGAAAVVSTTAGITSQDILPMVQDKVTAIVLDENGFEREDSMAPLFAAEFELDPCFVLIGDQQQLAPPTSVDERKNPFQPQLKSSFMARMISVGMPYIMLSEQYRMVNDIVALSNKLIYNGELTNAPTTSLENRPHARKFQEYAEKLVGEKVNTVLIDVNGGQMNWTIRTPSKQNCFIVCVVESIILELLLMYGQYATIAILTAYRAQLFKYKSMVGRMKELGVANTDKILIDSIDSSQGREYDIVVLDVLSDGSLGHQRYSDRMNVAMTRARDGLVVVCDKAKVRRGYFVADGGRKSYPYYLEALVGKVGKRGLLEDREFIRPREDGFPVTRYYTPDRAAVLKSQRQLRERLLRGGNDSD